MGPQDNTQLSAADYPVEYDSLQDFRIQYLQMIVRFWADPKCCVNSYNTYAGTALQWLAHYSGGGPPVPWCTKLSLNFEDGPQWDPTAGYGRLGWILEKQAKFTIYLPVEALRGVEDGDRPHALAAFTRDHSSLLTTKAHSSKPKRNVNGIDPDAGLGPAGLPTMRDFREFDGVCTRVLALSVADKGFWRKMQNPLGAKDALSDLLDYTLPWNMALHFMNDEKATWKDSCWTLTDNELELFVPQKPKTSSESTKTHGHCDKTPGLIEMIALASYNETGADHPLTCP